MSAGTGNTTPLGDWPVDLSGLRRSADRDFLAGLNSVVAIEFDVSYLGEAVGRRGSPSANKPDRWQIVEGFEAIPCRLVLRQAMLTAGAARPGETADGRVLFGQAIPADRRNRLVYQDPTFGERFFYLLGKVRDAHEMGHHWVVDVTETPTT
jgi:hypothetical protein